VQGSDHPVLDQRLANDLPAHDLAQVNGLRVVVAVTLLEMSDQVERPIGRPREAAPVWVGVAAVEAACAAVAAEVAACAAAEVAAVVVVVAAEAEVVAEGAPISPSSTMWLYWAISLTVSATIASATTVVIAPTSA